jgi:hypothetical protein
MILEVTNCKQWSKSVQEIKMNDIFYTNAFASIYGQTKLFIYKRRNNIAIFPFMIKGNTLSSLYYGGMLYKKYDKIFFNEAIDDLCQYCKKNNLIKITVRKHPTLSIIKMGKVIKKEPFVYIDLRESYIELKNAISKLHFKCIKKAFRERLSMFETRQFRYLKTFYKFYKNILERKGVSPQNFSYFMKIFLLLRNNTKFICVKYKEEIIAVSIILRSNDNIFMMYGGMNETGYKKFAKHFMIHNLIVSYKKKGYKNLILGTGNTEGDSIYQFKRGFTNKNHYIYSYGKELH